MFINVGSSYKLYIQVLGRKKKRNTEAVFFLFFHIPHKANLFKQFLPRPHFLSTGSHINLTTSGRHTSLQVKPRTMFRELSKWEQKECVRERALINTGKKKIKIKGGGGKCSLKQKHTAASNIYPTYVHWCSPEKMGANGQVRFELWRKGFVSRASCDSTRSTAQLLQNACPFALR